MMSVPSPLTYQLRIGVTSHHNLPDPDYNPHHPLLARRDG